MTCHLGLGLTRGRLMGLQAPPRKTQTNIAVPTAKPMRNLRSRHYTYWRLVESRKPPDDRPRSASTGGGGGESRAAEGPNYTHSCDYPRGGNVSDVFSSVVRTTNILTRSSPAACSQLWRSADRKKKKKIHPLVQNTLLWKKTAEMSGVWYIPPPPQEKRRPEF
jgi:hypothetical protein